MEATATQPSLIHRVIGLYTVAARLQSMTRELDAAVAIDDTTFRRAGPICSDFTRHGGLVIRGRSQTETVYTLPLGSLGDALDFERHGDTPAVVRAGYPASVP